MDAFNFARLHRVLDTGDLELRFHDCRSAKAHSLKLKVASLDGVLHNLIEDVVGDQIIAGDMRKRTASGDSDTAADIPGLTVRRQNPCHHSESMHESSHHALWYTHHAIGYGWYDDLGWYIPACFFMRISQNTPHLTYKYSKDVVLELSANLKVV